MRRFVLVLVVGLAGSLLAAASAAAQGATLRLSKQVVTPGEVITIEGSGFSRTAVDIRLATRDGEVLREAAGPSPSVDFRVPLSLSPGWYLLVATQVTQTGRHRGFTPGRARLRVVAAGSGAGLPPAGGSTVSGPPTPLLFAIIGLIVLAASLTLTVRRIRTLDRPLGN